MHPNDLDQLVQSITELVLAKLRSSAQPAQQARTLTVLWPTASAAREQVLSAVSTFREEGRSVQWLVAAGLVGELSPRLPAREQPRCHSLEQAPVEAILSNLQSTGVVLLAGVNFQAARQLLALEDDRTWIHVLLQAHLTGQPVVICDDLLSSRGLAAQSPVAQEAEGLKRRLRQMGFQLIAARDLATALKNLTLSVRHGSQDTRELLTEQDVEDLARAGHKELRLHAKTLVTPLARSRAAELGLDLLRVQE